MQSRPISIRVKCDSTTGCGKLFNVSKLKDRAITPEITVRYFECPKCNQKYLTDIFNYEISALKNSPVTSKKEVMKLQLNLLNNFSDYLTKEGFDFSKIGGK